MSDDVQEPPWLDLNAAAAKSGLGRETIRARARRGMIPMRKGNDGRVLVQLPPGTVASVDQGEPWTVAELLDELAEVRERAARLMAERDAAVAVGEAQAAAKAELIEELRALLADLRRPWWRRWWG